MPNVLSMELNGRLVVSFCIGEQFMPVIRTWRLYLPLCIPSACSATQPQSPVFEMNFITILPGPPCNKQVNKVTLTTKPWASLCGFQCTPPFLFPWVRHRQRFLRLQQAQRG